MTVRRIAVVGAGPKGLYCLERLAAELRRAHDRAQVEVHVFEPHPVPGAGPVYDPNQPDYLRMNFASGKIDMWSRNAESAEQATTGPSFVDFLAARGLAASDCSYAPRRLVGSYLHDGFERVIDSLRAVASVSIHAEAVDSVVHRDTGFDITTPTQTMECDEVLIATGHGSRTSPKSSGISPYPIDQPGGVCDIAPGSTVAVRGMGLTAIDVALALTEGRGGRFVPGAVPGQLTYEPSGLEPRAICLYSRTGRPMVPKPHPTLMPGTEAIAAACLEGSRKLAAIGATGTGSVFFALVETAAAILHHATGDDDCDRLIRQHVKTLLARTPIAQKDPVLAMRTDVEAAYGQRKPGAEWALGTAWRGVYPALVDLVETRIVDGCWSAFSSLATEMERVAFGPPAENAARLLALVEAGIVDMSCAANPVTIDEDQGAVLHAGTIARRCDTTVNAVIDPPGAAPGPSPLIASLLDAGIARKTAHSPGLDVCADGTCFGPNGEPTVGLAAVGRPTEGSILGNDTLSRNLHDTPARWAATVVRRLCTTTESSEPMEPTDSLESSAA